MAYAQQLKTKPKETRKLFEEIIGKLTEKATFSRLANVIYFAVRKTEMDEKKFRMENRD